MTKTKMYQEDMPRKNAKKSVDQSIKKRKRVVINFKQREQVIKRLQSGASVDDICLEFSISKRIVYSIKQVGLESLERFRAENPNSGVRKVHKFSTYPSPDPALKLWFYKARGANINITLDLIQCQSMIFYRELYPNQSKFTGSYGFAQRFVERHSIIFCKQYGEQLSADSEAIQPFI